MRRARVPATGGVYNILRPQSKEFRGQLRFLEPIGFMGGTCLADPKVADSLHRTLRRRLLPSFRRRPESRPLSPAGHGGGNSPQAMNPRWQFLASPVTLAAQAQTLGLVAARPEAYQYLGHLYRLCAPSDTTGQRCYCPPLPGRYWSVYISRFMIQVQLMFLTSHVIYGYMVSAPI